jgi:hypothetical protein
MKKERLARGWSPHHLSERTAYDPAHLSRIENGLRPPARALAIACDAAFPERHGWFTDYYDESRQWAEVPPGFRDWSELDGIPTAVPSSSLPFTSLTPANCPAATVKRWLHASPDAVSASRTVAARPRPFEPPASMSGL